MSNHGMWVKVALVGLFCAVVAQADHHEGKGLTTGGSFEGGYAFTWATGVNDSQFLVDHAALNMTGNISDKTSVVINNAFAIGTGRALAGGNADSSSTYFSGATIGGAASFLYSNLGAYIQHKCAEGVTTSVGHMRTPFGMEGLWSRYDMPTYYYSAGYTTANASGWNYDLGVKFTLTDIIPGNVEVSLLDGHRANQAGENFSPAGALRWWYEMKGGDWTFTPVVSTYLGRWHGGPEDLGITAGGMLKMGAMFANLEWINYSRNTTPAGTARSKQMSIYLEPGMDLGMAEVSLKGEFVSSDLTVTGTNTTDINVGVAVGKTYTEKYRIRAVYQHSNLGAKLGAHTNDFRLLFGTKW